MTKFGFESTGAEVAEELHDRIKDRTIVITGASSGGIGGETAISLATGAPRQLILLSRDILKCQSMIDTLKAKYPTVEVSFIPCDLSSQIAIRKAATEISNRVPYIDILINNAAIPPGPYSKTEDGIESQFGVNHIGHFLLTNHLIPKILAAKPGARIVNVSSSSHKHRTHASFDNYNFSDGATYSEWEGYIQSKQANVLFTKSLAERLGPYQMQAFSLHPGSIMSGMQVHVPKAAMEEALKRRQDAAAIEGKELQRAKRKTIEQGSSTTLVAALDPSIAEQSGAYLEDGNIAKNGPPSFATDMGNAERLWELSEKLVEQKFDWT